MTDEIKTEDIIKNLRQCSSGMGFMDCFDCTLEGLFHPCDDDNSCKDELHRLAADRLEQLSNQHIKTQYCSKELTISEMCGRMDEATEEWMNEEGSNEHWVD